MTALTILIGIIFWPLYTGPLPTHLLGVTLQILAALTLPHMIFDAVLTVKERDARHGEPTLRSAREAAFHG